MTLQPATVGELADALCDANARGTRISGFDLRALNRIVDFVPEDMTVTVEAGLTLGFLQTELARRGQWLPIDPPHPAQLSIGALVASNASGPRRYGFGTVRDWLIGIKVALGDGRIIKSGGRVVKNVAGYDLAKLFIGSRGSLGVIVEASFKLRPLPESERLLQINCESSANAIKLIDAVVESDLTPVVFDLHRISPSASRPSAVLVLGFAGSREEVEWQVEQAGVLGINALGTLDYATNFWEGQPRPQCLSILPSTLGETIERLGGIPFVARAGNGIVYHRGEPPPKSSAPLKLMQRIKDEFDPKHILPDFSQ